MTTDEQFDNWLADPMFEVLKAELEAEIYQRQCDTLETAANWDVVMFNRGWCSALAYIRQLREVRENLTRNVEGQFDGPDSTE